MDTEYLRVQGLMSQLESELKRLSLWRGDVLAQDQSASDIPFCHDTMQLHEWLEWVFLPTLDSLLETGAPLPQDSDVSSYAEWVLPQQVTGRDVRELLSILRLLDKAMSS